MIFNGRLTIVITIGSVLRASFGVPLLPTEWNGNTAGFGRWVTPCMAADDGGLNPHSRTL